MIRVYILKKIVNFREYEEIDGFLRLECWLKYLFIRFLLSIVFLDFLKKLNNRRFILLVTFHKCFIYFIFST